MIAKLETGNGFGGVLRYDVRADKDTARENAKVLDACGVSIGFDADGNLLIDPKRVGFDFRQQVMGYTGKGVIRKPVYHWVLSYHPDDNVSEEQMIKDAKEFLKRIGFDDTQYVITVHYDKEHHHLHIVTNIVNNQGERIPTMGLIDRAHEAAAAITKERGYIWGKKTKKENITKAKMHKPHERARKILEPLVRECLAQSTSFENFRERLFEVKDCEIICNYMSALDGKRGRLSFTFYYEDEWHSFNGSSIARDLSYAFVAKTINENFENIVMKDYIALRPLVERWYGIVESLYETILEQEPDFPSRNPEIEEHYTRLCRAFEEYKTIDPRNYHGLEEIEGIVGKDPVEIPIYLLGYAACDTRLLAQAVGEDFPWEDFRPQIEAMAKEASTLKFRSLDVRYVKSGGKEKLMDSIGYSQIIKNDTTGLQEILKKWAEKEKREESFDFAAALAQMPTERKPAERQKEPFVPGVDIYSLLMSASNREMLERKLLDANVVIEPILDNYNGVSDFKVSFAEEAQIINASRLLPAKQLREMLDRWESLTGEKLAYKLAIEREQRKKLEGICKKFDKVFLKGSPRTPNSISFRPDGTVLSVSFKDNAGRIETYTVDPDNIIRWEDGMAFDVESGKYYPPIQQQEVETEVVGYKRGR